MNYFFLSDKRLIGSSIFPQIFLTQGLSRLARSFKVFRWLKVFLLAFKGSSKPTKRLLCKTYLNIWINQLWKSHPFNESVRCIRQMAFVWIRWIDVSINMSEVFLVSVISQQKCQKEGFCRTIVTLFGFSWKWINRHVKHAKNCVTHLPNLENTVTDYLT